MVVAAINPNLSSKYLLVGSHISAPDGSVTAQPFKAESHFSNYLGKPSLERLGILLDS